MVYGTYQKAQPSAWYSQAFGKADVFVAGTFLSTQRGLDTQAASPILHDAELGGNAFGGSITGPMPSIGSSCWRDFLSRAFRSRSTRRSFRCRMDRRGRRAGSTATATRPPRSCLTTRIQRSWSGISFLTVAYTHALSNGKVQLAPYVRSFYGDLNCDPVNSLGPTADPGSVCSNVTRYLLHEGQNATYAWNAGEAHRWKAGVVFDDAQSQVNYTQFTRDDLSAAAGPDPAATISGQDNTNILSGGVFVQDEITLGGLKLLPGVRADFQNATFTGTTQPNLFLAGPSARLGFSYALSDAFLLHGFVGYLWQPPNAVDASVAARALVPGLAGQTIPVDLKAETDETAEIGVTYRVPRLEVGLTGYGRLAQDTLDVQNVGSTDLYEDYNYTRGRAVGVELAYRATVNKFLSGFGNGSWNVAQGQGIDSEQYLFTPSQLAYSGWQTLDHVQVWTVNAGADLHDESGKTHLAVLFQYGSGLRTGPDNNETVPGHSTWNVTLRHRFDFFVHPEVALDVYNALDAVYAIRIGNGFVGSAYGPLRQVNARLTIPFGG